MLRLYRAGSLPRDTEQSLANMPEWVRDAIHEDGAHQAWGRWFTPNLNAALWYAKDAEQLVRYIDVCPDQAREWLVRDNPIARKFSRDPDNEYFVPPDVANTAVFL